MTLNLKLMVEEYINSEDLKVGPSVVQSQSDRVKSVERNDMMVYVDLLRLP